MVNDLGASIAGEGYSEAPANDVVEEIRGAGGEAVANFDDVATPDGSGAVAQALAEFGTVDIVVNNAGRLEHHPFEELPYESFLEMQRVHYFGTFNTTQAAYRVMRD